MNKEEILKLSELSEKEQYVWLIKNEVMIHMLHNGRNQVTNESLADCAFRLRNEYGFWHRYKSLMDLYDIIEPDLKLGVNEWLLNEAQPIHWIQAALLAKCERTE